MDILHFGRGRGGRRLESSVCCCQVKVSRALSKFKIIRSFSTWAGLVHQQRRAMKISYHLANRRDRILLLSVLREIADHISRVKAKYHAAYLLHVLWTKRKMRALFEAFRVPCPEVKQRHAVTSEEVMISRGFEALRGRNDFLFTGLGRKVSQRMWEAMVIRRSQQQLKGYIAKVNLKLNADLMRRMMLLWYHHTFAAVRLSFKLNYFLGLRMKRQLLSILTSWREMSTAKDRLVGRIRQLDQRRRVRVKSRVMFL